MTTKKTHTLFLRRPFATKKKHRRKQETEHRKKTPIKLGVVYTNRSLNVSILWITYLYTSGPYIVSSIVYTWYLGSKNAPENDPWSAGNQKEGSRKGTAENTDGSQCIYSPYSEYTGGMESIYLVLRALTGGMRAVLTEQYRPKYCHYGQIPAVHKTQKYCQVLTVSTQNYPRSTGNMYPQYRYPKYQLYVRYLCAAQDLEVLRVHTHSVRTIEPLTYCQ